MTAVEMNQMNRTTVSASTALILVLGIALGGCSPDTTEVAAGPAGDAVPSSAQVARGAEVPEVIVVIGMDGLQERLKQEGWWGKENHKEQLTVPHLMITRIHPAWRIVAQEMTVPDKKETFYRLMLPLVMHANDMVMERRGRLLETQAALEAGDSISQDDLEQLQRAAVLLRALNEQDAAALTAASPELGEVLDDLLYRLDVIPAGLALGQAAYESGYGTSRFAAEGNALFGQWTYGGGGLAPKEKRASKGNYGIAAFDWPFDSVRGYFINLMSHPAYEDFRRLRAELRAAGKPLSSLRLADGLVRYSERGQEYVDSLKGIIRVNGLEIADDAVFRDEPIRFIVTEGSPEEAAAMEQQIAEARASGELAEIYARMRLD
jgi:Bax protein